MLKELIQQKKAKIGIIGFGYVGMPLAVEFASQGFSVTGFEIDESKVKSVNSGISYIQDISSETLKRWVSAKKLSATTNFKLLSKMNVIIICVPTPLRKSKDPDISYIVSPVEKINENRGRNKLI